MAKHRKGHAARDHAKDRKQANNISSLRVDPANGARFLWAATIVGSAGLAGLLAAGIAPANADTVNPAFGRGGLAASPIDRAGGSDNGDDGGSTDNPRGANANRAGATGDTTTRKRPRTNVVRGTGNLARPGNADGGAKVRVNGQDPASSPVSRGQDRGDLAVGDGNEQDDGTAGSPVRGSISENDDLQLAPDAPTTSTATEPSRGLFAAGSPLNPLGQAAGGRAGSAQGGLDQQLQAISQQVQAINSLIAAAVGALGLGL